MLLLLSHWISKLPLQTAIDLGRFLGLLCFYCLPIRYSVVVRNIRRAFGEDLPRSDVRRIARDCYAQQGMYGIELLRLPSLTRETCDSIIEYHGLEHIDAALARGKGVIIMASHMDNTDYAGCGLALRGLPVCVTARDIHSKSLNAFLSAVRSSTGVTLIPPRKSKDLIQQLLSENKLVCFVVDQHAAKYRSVVCTFFDLLASTSHAPARFAYETGAVILPAYIYRIGHTGKHVGRFFAPFELESPHSDHTENLRHNTQRLNHIIEGWIREHPGQWLWFHQRWKVHDHPEGWDIPESLRHLVDQRRKRS